MTETTPGTVVHDAASQEPAGPDAASRGLAVPSRSRAYLTVVGAGVLTLVLGLLVPFVVADPASELAASGASGGEDLAADLSGFEPTGAQDTSTETDGASGGDATSDADQGGSTGGVTDPSGADGGGSGPQEPRTASDVGVTADSVEVGILVPSAAFGGGDASQAIGDVAALWQAQVDAANAAGGIDGRTIVPVYREYDALSFDEMQAACVFLTEDAQVFAVLNAGGFYGDPVLCITEQHATPFIGQSPGIAEHFTRSGGRFFSTGMSKERTLLNFVARMEADGQLAGRKIGILDRDGVDRIPVSNALIPALKRLGYTVTHRATIADDFAIAQSQIPLEVQEMQRKGVDLVLPNTGFTHGVLFVHNADSQGFHPRYALSDFAGGASDIYGLGMSDSFDGAVGYTSLRTGEGRVGLPEATYDAECRATAEAGVGHSIARDSGEYYSAVTACGILDQFAIGFSRAGANPTQTTFTEALTGIGEFQSPYSGLSSYFPGKTDAPDVIRRVSWSKGCQCWTPQTDFTRAQF